MSMTPAGVESMVLGGHEMLVEKGAGEGSGFSDERYVKAGATMVDRPKEIYERAGMVMHVKEPLSSEYGLIRKDQIVFTYLHLAAFEELTRILIKSGSICIAYETIQKADGALPLLTPMSEVAGRMAIQEGAKYLEMAQGGRGVLLGGVPGVEPGTVVVIGGGVVGVNAAKMACGLGAKVYVLDKNLDRLRHLSEIMPANCFPLMSNASTIRKLIREADVVVGGRIGGRGKGPPADDPGHAEDHEKGSCAGGCGHRPGRVLRDLQANYPWRPGLRRGRRGPLLRGQHARRGGQDLHPGFDQRHHRVRAPNRRQRVEKGDAENEEIRKGANVVKGKVTCKGVADAFGLEYTPVGDVLGD